jgi:hypothetical protein
MRVGQVFQLPLHLLRMLFNQLKVKVREPVVCVLLALNAVNARLVIISIQTSVKYAMEVKIVRIQG